MKQTLEMAREAGLHRQQHNLMSNPIQYRYSYDGYEENLKAFEALVRADEREACAKACEDDAFVEQWKGLAEAVRRIRARGRDAA